MRFPQILLTTALIAIGGAAVAQPSWHASGAGEELLRGLNLTDAQTTQIHGIEQTARVQARATMEQLRAVHEQGIATLLGTGTVTAADLAPLAGKEEALRAQLDQLHIGTMLQIRQVLTPAQLAEASAKFAQLVSLREQEHQVIENGAAQ